MLPMMVVHVSWLIVLSFIGDLGGYVSGRAGGSARALLTAVIFPILPYLAFFAIGLPVALILDDQRCLEG